MRFKSGKTSAARKSHTKEPRVKNGGRGSPVADARRLLHEHTSKLKIIERPINSLIPHRGNPRTHSDKQIALIVASIGKFGFTNPILIDRNGVVIGGHGRLEAVRRLGWIKVPTIRLDHLNEAERRAYALADNKLALLANWDPELLAIEFRYLNELDIDFDVALTGFDTAEIDLYLDPATSGRRDDPADALPAADSKHPPVSRLGDLWELGPHRLICGDTRDAANFRRLLGDGVAQMVWTDPPYNVAIERNVSGLGKKKHKNFVMAAGEMPVSEFAAFLRAIMKNHARFSANGSIHYFWIDWRSVDTMVTAGRQVYAEFKGLAVWNKDNAGMGTFYRQRHELVCIFKHGTARHINNFELGQHGRYRSNVWDAPVPRAIRADHPTPKPVSLTVDAIKDCSRRKGIILDGFAGSGTTIIAAEKTGRLARCVELDPQYVDVAIRRWEQWSGKPATLSRTGETYAQVMRQRHVSET